VPMRGRLCCAVLGRRGLLAVTHGLDLFEVSHGPEGGVGRTARLMECGGYFDVPLMCLASHVVGPLVVSAEELKQGNSDGCGSTLEGRQRRALGAGLALGEQIVLLTDILEASCGFNAP